ncbi:hypothetical protein [Hyphomicrobium sp. CS1GBMeth3]|uniref:hypothetical protein n=1 Tax=Hyphomicrobium sp. CS1GBMeth3 TaxID=1892845 RepID=UPI000931F6E4|nr:hypothetical protein [Hyphomicrobium sp. CS1GBMeth3]
MSKRSFLAIVCAIAVLTPLASAEAQRGRDDWRPDNRTDWELLGSAQIGTRLERDVIEVGRREGRFQSIGFTVTGGEARIEDLRIVYGGGQSEDLRVREVFKPGTRSRPIDLGRGGEFIQRIEITYRAFGPVKIDFYGEKRRGPEWALLGCQRVGFLETKDVIRVGRREGAFRALKLQVNDGTLRLNRMRVVFGDRSSQVLDVRAAIPKGTETRPIDLDGRRRVIERIELDYLPSLNLKRGPEVCVLALEAGGHGPGRR